jgi:hypothetical protein
MAGKADLVNSIAYSAVGTRKLAPYDGWGDTAATEDDWGYASLLDTPPPDGSVRIGPGGGGAG